MTRSAIGTFSTECSGTRGLTEDRLWRPKFPARTTIAGKPAWRSGAWVAAGHLGTVDRMLRYRGGRWQRIGLVGDRWRAIDDGR